MDSALTEPFKKGKREAEDAVDFGVAKRQRVEEIVSEMKTDAIGDKEEVEAKLSVEDGLLESVLKGESNTVSGNKPAVTAEGRVAAASQNDESNCDTDSCCQDKTNLDDDVTVTIRAPAPLREDDPVAPHRPKDESSMHSGCCPKDETFSDDDVTGAISSCSDWCPKDETFSDDDVTGAIVSLLAPSIPISLASVQKKDDSRTVKIDSAPKTDDSVATAKKGPVAAWEKKDEPGSGNEMFDEVASESIPSLLTKKEDETNDELELDDETSSSDDDDNQTPATPTEQTTGGKTLFVGNLSFSIEQEDVENFFKAAGEVVNIRFGMNSDEMFKGYGYVEFASVEAAQKAFRELNGKELLRRRVRIDFAKERGTFAPYNGCQDTETFQKEGKAPGNTVFVRGFIKTDSQDEIRRSLEEHFGSCGEISRVSVPKDQDGCVRGIAYILFKDRDSFNRALALNGSEFRDGTLSVKEATSRADSRDIAGSSRGYGRNDLRYGWRDFSGRSIHEHGGGRSNWRDFSGRSDRRDFGGTRGAREAGGGRGDWRDLSGRRGGGGRGEWRDFSGRRGVGEAGGGRGDWRDFSGRRGSGAGGGRGDWRHSGGRGNWFQTGAWQDYSRKSGYGNYSNGSPFIRGTSGWLGGGGRGQGTPSEPCVTAAPEGNGSNTYVKLESGGSDEAES